MWVRSINFYPILEKTWPFAISLKFVEKSSFGDFKAVPIQINQVFLEEKKTKEKNPTGIETISSFIVVFVFSRRPRCLE